MIPGPVGASSEALAEMGLPVLAHYGTEWVRLHSETVNLAKEVFRTGGDVFLIPGSGSAGLEACIAAIAGPESKILIPSNGEYGERLSMMARAYTPRQLTVRFDVRRPLPIEKIRDALDADPQISAIAAVHCETATSVLNPIGDLAAVCAERGRILMVDAVSSLGGIEFEMDTWGIALCATASQKCLETPPGLSLVAVSEAAWEWIFSRGGNAGWYLNLRVWKDYAGRWADWHPYPVTLNTNNVMALRTSLAKIMQEGLTARFARHIAAAKTLRNGLTEMGFRLFVDEQYAAPTVTSVCSDRRIAIPDLLKYVEDKHGILLAGSGSDELEGQLFRVGHMGPEATQEAIVSVLVAIEDALRSSDCAMRPGKP